MKAAVRRFAYVIMRDFGVFGKTRRYCGGRFVINRNIVNIVIGNLVVAYIILAFFGV